jgi:hypothetical protein
LQASSCKKPRNYTRNSNIEQQRRSHGNVIRKQRVATDDRTTCAAATQSTIDAIRFASSEL